MLTIIIMIMFFMFILTFISYQMAYNGDCKATREIRTVFTGGAGCIMMIALALMTEQITLQQVAKKSLIGEKPAYTAYYFDNDDGTRVIKCKRTKESE